MFYTFSSFQPLRTVKPSGSCMGVAEEGSWEGER